MTVVESDRFVQHPLKRQRLRVVPGRGEIDLAAAEEAVADLLVALGKDPADEHLADTPRRVAKSYAELLTPLAFDLTTFPDDERYDELVLARSILLNSLCEHHLLPFHGVAHVGYLPGGVRAACSRTVTSALHGLLRDSPVSRQEFFALAGVRT